MTYIIICLILYLILGLLLWSLCAINKGYFPEINKSTESAGVKKAVLGIPFPDAPKLDTGCQVYIIQSLYSKDFISPDEAGPKYKFRNSLPSIDEA
jgi:hypothetical protein